MSISKHVIRLAATAVLAILISSSLLPGQIVAGGKSSEELRREIEAARAKVEALEREAQVIERRENAQREVDEMKQDARRRIAESQEEFDELSQPAEDGITPARRAQRDARMDFLKQYRTVNARFDQLKSDADREKASELQQERELIEHRWNVLTTDYHQHRVELEEAMHTASERGKGHELLLEAQRLLEQDARDGEAEVALREKRVKTDNAFHKLLEKFERLTDQ